MFGFINIFRKKETKLLEYGLNRDVVEGFIDKIEDIVCIVDYNYKIDYINKPEIQDKYLFELLEYDHNKEVYNEIINITKDEGFYANDIEIVKQNQKINLYIAMYYVQKVNKYLVYIKNTNKYLKNQNILKEKLNQSNEELKNKALFIANLSHEIKTPINIIIGMIYFLKSTKLDESQNEYVNKLDEASNLLTSLVNNILNVTKTEHVTNAINAKEQFVLKNLIEKVENIFEDELVKKNIQWSVESNFDLNIEIYEDKTRLEQILINLLSNAVKYTEKGYVELEINKIKEDVNSYYFRFCVKDTGVGIKREDTIKIFKEFEQTSDPTIKEQEGFGLGLPIVKKIIESMGGKIWVESSYGLGTKFFFELKVLKNIEYMKRKDINNKQEVIQNSELHTIKTNKILLVDDNHIINEITEKVLKEIDLECDIVDNGIDAIKKVEEFGKNYYALILMDIHMPKYNGYDISRIMKEELGVNTPIVALTATNITDEVIEDNKEYIYTYIQKPVKPEELKNTVKYILKNVSNVYIKDKKRKTILLIADKIKNWEIIENLNNLFNVICTLNSKDINIIISTKKLDAIIYDQSEQEFMNSYYYDTKETMALFLNYNTIEDEQKDITLTDLNGYIKRIEDITSIGYVLLEMIEKRDKESKREKKIEGYDNEISEVYKFLYDSLVNLTSV